MDVGYWSKQGWTFLRGGNDTWLMSVDPMFRIQYGNNSGEYFILMLARDEFLLKKHGQGGFILADGTCLGLTISL